MYTDDQSIKQFKRMHARNMLAMEARHIGEECGDGDIVSGHLKSELTADRLIALIAAIILGICAAATGFYFSRS